MITALIFLYSFNTYLGYSGENETSKRKLYFACSEAFFQKAIRNVVLMGEYISHCVTDPFKNS